MRVALVHPWFLSHGGAEQVVVALAKMYPDADIHTIFYDEQQLPPGLKGHKIFASKWNFLPGKYRYYRHLLPFYGFAFEAMDLTGYDLVITSDSSVAKTILVPQNAVHICYCHSPMRCLYDQYRDYVSQLPAIGRPIFKLAAHYLRMLDFTAASRVSAFVGVSKNISERIHSFYHRNSTLIYPPVDTSHGILGKGDGDYYLTVGRLTRGKRVDILIEACNRLGRRLVVAGSGRELHDLKAIAGPTIEFVGRVPDDVLSDLYAGARALLFAANEDFGIVPVEAQSYGRPVIALGHGGALETVIDNITGIYFDEQTPQSLVDGIVRFETAEHLFEPAVIRKHACMFDTSIFRRSIFDLVDSLVERRTRANKELVITRKSA